MKKKTSIKPNGIKIFRFSILCFFILSFTSIIFSEDITNERLRNKNTKESLNKVQTDQREVDIPEIKDPISEEVKQIENKNESKDLEDLLLKILPLFLIIILFTNQVLLFLKINKNQEIFDKAILNILDTNKKLLAESSRDIKGNITDLEKKISEFSAEFNSLKGEIDSLTNEKKSNFSINQNYQPTQKEPEVQPKIYQYFRALDSSDETESSDKRAAYRIWRQGEQLFFEINSEIQSHKFLFEGSDDFLIGKFDYTNGDGNRIQNISPGMLEIDGDGKFKITKMGKIQIING